MPAKKKEQKYEEPVYVDEEGVFVHEAEGARYKGSIRRLNVPAGDAAPGAAGATASAAAAGGGGTSGNTSTRASVRTAGTSAAAVAAAAAAAATATSVVSGNTATAHDGGTSLSVASVASASLPRYRHGVGTYTSPALHYTGDWYEDAMHGQGSLHFVHSGCHYTGAFVHGKLEGRGVYTWPDGARYDGMWRDNRMHGEGTFTDADGHVWHGKFYNGTGPGLARLYSQAAATTASHS